MAPKTSKIILLTGAGFSSLVGYKTLSAIVNALDGVHLPLNSDSPEIELIRETWKIIKGQKGDKATLEDLLGRLKYYTEVAELIKGDHIFSGELRANLPHVISGQFKRKWENALNYCFRLMLENYGPEKAQTNADGYDLIQEVLTMVAKSNGGNLHLFTTNYDCGLNVMAANSKTTNFYSHINNKDGAYENKWYLVTESAHRKENPNLYLHRLHGCVGWFFDPRFPYGIHEIYGSGQSLSIDDPNKLNQMAIKLVSDEKIGNIPAFSLAFQELSEVIMKCEKILVWGHSFRDREVLRCMITVAEKRKGRSFQIYYVDPYLDEKVARGNIRNTIIEVPGISHNILKPIRINWVVQDGYAMLKEQIEQIL